MENKKPLAGNPIDQEKSKVQPQEKQKDKTGQTAKPKQKKTGMQKAFGNIGMLFLAFLFGALVVTLVLYLPAANDLRETQTELERLSQIESDFDELNQAYQATSAKAGLYEILNNTSLLQIALTNKQSDRINQYLQYLEEDIGSLELAAFPDIPENLSSQFQKINAIIKNKPQQAMDDLESFQKDILVLIDNLE